MELYKKQSGLYDVQFNIVGAENALQWYVAEELELIRKKQKSGYEPILLVDCEKQASKVNKFVRIKHNQTNKAYGTDYALKAIGLDNGIYTRTIYFEKSEIAQSMRNELREKLISVYEEGDYALEEINLYIVNNNLTIECINGMDFNRVSRPVVTRNKLKRNDENNEKTVKNVKNDEDDNSLGKVEANDKNADSAWQTAFKDKQLNNGLPSKRNRIKKQKEQERNM